MAEQTTSSIVIAASPAEVMAVIADFPAYPEWAQGMKLVEVVEQGADGRADTVYFELEAAPIKDTYTLGYVWNGDSSVTWELVEGKMLKAMTGAYELRDAGSGTEVTYRLAVDLEHPDDRDASSQGGEGHHRHRAEGPEEARRVARLSGAGTDHVSVRIILFTGKGGVGKTTTAAGTAALAARSGLRTLVLSTDAAHSLGDAFGVPLGGEPVEVAPRLSVHQVDTQRRFERSWGEIQGYLMSVLDAAGVDPITAEELTVIPGAEEVLALLELRNHVVSGEWDVVVVDCAPTAETLRLLALPEALSWYMTRMFGVQRRVVKALRPMLTKAAGVPMPEDAVFDAIERLHRDLEQVQQILTEKEATVRLVLTPETVVVAEARRSLTTLSLYGYRVDGVIANRVFPDGGGDSWREGWVASQRTVLSEVRQSFVDLPIWLSEYSPGEPVGVERAGRVRGGGVRRDRPARRAGRGGADDHHAHPHRRRAPDRAPVRPACRRRPRPAR